MKNIIIVGGGTAGWMSAAFLSHIFKTGVKITLVDSELYEPIGVGEATIPPIRLFNRLLGISDELLVKKTGATFKLGIRFEGWGKEGDSYMHAFGPTGEQIGLTPFWHYWMRGKALGVNHHFNDYSLTCLAARDNFFSYPEEKSSKLEYAWHFDASRYASLLKEISLKQGVNFHRSTMTEVHLAPDSGIIEGISLTDGATLSGDLFIDCTGPRSLLLGKALGVAFDSWNHWLPCDRAIAVQTGNIIHEPYTRSTAHDFGWQWQIPLQHRTGNGMVFSSRYCSEALALETLLKNIGGEPVSEPKVIRFTPGRYKNQWQKNCVAIGLSSGFLEPLESTSIHMIQSSLIRLAKLFPDNCPDSENRAEFNRQARLEAERARDFILLHYLCSTKTSQFWADIRVMDIPEELETRIRLFEESGYIKRRDEELFSENAWSQVFIGQGKLPKNTSFLSSQLSDQDCAGFLKQIMEANRRNIHELESHQIFIERLLS